MTTGYCGNTRGEGHVNFLCGTIIIRRFRRLIMMLCNEVANPIVERNTEHLNAPQVVNKFLTVMEPMFATRSCHELV